jgi:thiamine pyrophosphate-dependent acetolactate synthase large subunit-like protein
MGKTISDQVIEVLVSAGVKRIFGLPGDAIDLILASIHKRSDVDFILTRHEEGAGFMATSHAKLTGELGVLMAAQGPGAAHTISPMYDAKMDKAPLLVITGQIESAHIGTDTVQEINQMSLFDDAAFFNREVRSANNLIDILQLAIQTAITKRCVAHVSIATDVLRLPALKRMPSKAVFNMPHKTIPDPSLIEQASDILNKKKKITILYGGGTIHAHDELLEVAGLLNARMVHTVRSKEIIDNNSPHYAGGIGFKGSKNGCHSVKDCDALLIVGCSFAWREFYPESVPIIQIDLESQRIGIHAHVALGLIGDARLTLQAMAKQLTQKTDDSFLKKAQKTHANAIKMLNKQAEEKKGKGISSPLLTRIISDHLSDDAVVSVDAGGVTVWANNWLRLNGKQRMVMSTELGTMGYGMPAAIGAQLAYPDRLVVAMCGDGGFQMTMADFSTAVKYNLPIKVVVFNNHAYHFIELEQMKEGVAQAYTKLNNPDYAKLAEAFGAEGYAARTADEVEPAIQAAFASDKPCIIDVQINSDELIKPTKITASLVMSFAKGMVKTKLSGSND